MLFVSIAVPQDHWIVCTCNCSVTFVQQTRPLRQVEGVRCLSDLPNRPHSDMTGLNVYLLPLQQKLPESFGSLEFKSDTPDRIQHPSVQYLYCLSCAGSRGAGAPPNVSCQQQQREAQTFIYERSWSFFFCKNVFVFRQSAAVQRSDLPAFTLSSQVLFHCEWVCALPLKADSLTLPLPHLPLLAPFLFISLPPHPFYSPTPPRLPPAPPYWQKGTAGTDFKQGHRAATISSTFPDDRTSAHEQEHTTVFLKQNISLPSELLIVGLMILSNSLSKHAAMHCKNAHIPPGYQPFMHVHGSIRHTPIHAFIC